MSFLQQIIQLLSEPPGNFVYHVITLLALQAALGQAIAQWRRAPQDQFARRLVWGSALLLLLRLSLLVVLAALLNGADPVRTAQIVPPLERAIDATTAVTLVWILITHARRLPHLGNMLLLLALILTGILYTFFAQDWAARAAGGLPYYATRQAGIWSLYQFVILSLGFAAITLARPRDWLLRLAILASLLLTHAADLWLRPLLPVGTASLYWVRPGYLIAFPLLAALAYRHTLAQLLAVQLMNRPAAEQLAQSLQRAVRVIDSLETSRTLNQALELVGDVLSAPFVALATVSTADPDYLRVTSKRPEGDAMQQPHHWGLKLSDWPAFHLAISQRHQVELLPTGVGARQLHDLYRELGINSSSALLIEPLLVGKRVLGLLLLGSADEQQSWPAAARAMTPSLAAYIARALHNARIYEEALATTAANPISTTAIQNSRILALEEARDQALANLGAAQDRGQELEAELAAEQQRSQQLAAALRKAEQTDTEEYLASLQAEVIALRESLMHAEEAMAMAAAGEQGLSTEWVTQTITRYSAELEKAEGQIAELEQQLQAQDRLQANEILVALVQELRTPMTSVAGYTEMLLNEQVGLLGARQRHFLQRVQANAERLRTLLEQIVQLTVNAEEGVLAAPELVDLQAVVEAAVNDVINQIREKELQLEITIAPNLPPLAINRGALYQLIRNLLQNASRASGPNGRIIVTARTGTVQDNGQVEALNFLQFSVSDSGGGILPEHRRHVFDFHHQADNPLIPGLGETGIGLLVTRAIVNAQGGRIWVDSEMGTGSTFSVLLPISNRPATGDVPGIDSHNGVQHDSGPHDSGPHDSGPHDSGPRAKDSAVYE